jgi:paraquat-inducible protein B
LAACVAAVIFVSFVERGPRITVRFSSGKGLKIGDPVIYAGAKVGEIISVSVSPEPNETFPRVAYEARLSPSADNFARSGTKFWIDGPEGRRFLEIIMPSLIQEPCFEFTGIDKDSLKGMK